MKNTQKDRILRHLQDYKSVTSWDSFTEYGITRLSAIIFILKKEGYEFTDEWISSKNRYNEKTQFKKYILIK